MSFLRDDRKLLPDQTVGFDELQAALLRAARKLKAALSAQHRAEEAERAGELIRRVK